MGNYFISHRRELLDAAGEWRHDAEAGCLHLGVDAASGATLPPTTLCAPIAQTVFSVQGTQADPVTNFRLSGVVVRNVAPAFLEAHVSSLHPAPCLLL